MDIRQTDLKRFTQKRVATQKNILISRLESELIEALSSDPSSELTKQTVLEHLRKKGVRHAVGTINNALSRLKGVNLVLSRRSFRCAYYRINPEVYGNREVTHMVGRSGGVTRNQVVSEEGFVSTVLELARCGGFESVCRVHDVHLVSSFWFVGDFVRRVVCEPRVWVSEACFRWVRNERAKCWTIHLFVEFDYRLTFQVFDVGRITCMVKCLKKAIPERLEGLRKLEHVIREGLFLVFGKNKRLWSFPELDHWTVTFWHRGKDSKTKYDCRFNVLWRNWVGGLSRIYVREEDQRLRVENFENPNRALGLLISEKEELQREWIKVEEEKKAIPGMVASCVASCMAGIRGKFVDLDPVS
jgi:hypothetical protein